MTKLRESTEPMLGEKPSPQKNRFLILITIPVFVCLHNVNEFRDLLLGPEILFLFICWLAVPFVILFFVKTITRLNEQQSLLLTFYITICFFFFGVLQDFLLRNVPIRLYGKSYFIFAVLLFVPLVFAFLFRKRNTRAIVSYLSRLFFILILYECILLCIMLVRSDSYLALSKTFKQELMRETNKAVARPKPDIYHFIFDSYTNSQALKKFWKYVNPIDSFLTNRGFRVVEGSFSNYDFTPFSMGSVFNLQYLSGTEKYLGRNGKNYYIGRMSFMDNEVFKVLKANNYTLNSFSLLDTIKYLQRLGTLGPQKPLAWLRNQTLERLYLNPWLIHKILGRFNNTPVPGDIARSYEAGIDYHRRVMNYFRTSVASSKNKDNPNFYLMHFFVPHEPYVFDEHGSIRFPVARMDGMKGYLSQLKFANTLIEQIVSTLLKDPKEKIIIIQGDHGYRSYEPGMIRTDQFSCFNAIYFYDSDYKDIYTGMSLANTYRLVFNKHFNYNLPLLKDSIFLDRSLK